MPKDPKLAAENMDVDKIKAFREMHGGAMEYAAQHNLPIQVVEGALRDALSVVDAMRLLGSMRKQGARI